MDVFLERLRRIDLAAAMQGLLEFLDGVDVCFLGLVVGVLVFLGSRMVAGQPALQRWGLRLAAATFLGYGAYLVFQGDFDGPTPWWRVAARAGCVAGGVLAGAWIVLPVLYFVHRRLRLVLAVFLGYGIYLVITTEEAEDFGWIAVQALLASGLALVIAWIVDPFWMAFARHLWPSSETPVAEPIPAPVRPVIVPHHLAGVLEATAPGNVEGQRRRDRARMQLELAYMQALPAIGSWLPRTLFDDFVRRHLSDQLSPVDVEDNARQFLQVLRQHQEQVRECGDFTTMEELSGWLLTEQQRIQGLTVEQPLKQTQLIDLHQRYLVMAARMMQKQTTLVG